jgi:hypothetical protein
MSMSFSTGSSSWKASCTYEPLLEACKDQAYTHNGHMKLMYPAMGTHPRGFPWDFPLTVAAMASYLLTSRYRLVTRELVSGRSWGGRNSHRYL